MMKERKRERPRKDRGSLGVAHCGFGLGEIVGCTARDGIDNMQGKE